MQIAGLQKLSLIDYPGRLSAVLFLSGCNFHCPYCHNPDLARGRLPENGGLSAEQVLGFLQRRRGFLDAVVISGGEPTLARGLGGFCAAIRGLGYRLKLDTNGSRPAVLAELLAAGRLDYVAMDLKAPPENYAPRLSTERCAGAIRESVALLRAGGVDHEFRTTCVPPFVDAPRIAAMARLVAGAPLWALQTFAAANVLDPDFFHGARPPYGPEEMAALRAAAAPHVRRCIVR